MQVRCVGVPCEIVQYLRVLACLLPISSVAAFGIPGSLSNSSRILAGRHDRRLPLVMKEDEARHVNQRIQHWALRAASDVVESPISCPRLELSHVFCAFRAFISLLSVSFPDVGCLASCTDTRMCKRLKRGPSPSPLGYFLAEETNVNQSNRVYLKERRQAFVIRALTARACFVGKTKSCHGATLRSKQLGHALL